jgi:hypothetical protein
MIGLLQQLQTANGIAPGPSRNTGLGRPIVPGSNRQRVLEWLDTVEHEFTTNQCAEATGIERTKVSVVLHDLDRKSGLVRRHLRDGVSWWRQIGDER